MNRPNFALSALISAALVAAILLLGAFYDPNGTSQSAFEARERPAAYVSSAAVWFLLFTPIWLPALPLWRRFGGTAIDLLSGLAGLSLAVFFLYLATGVAGVFIAFYIAGAAVLSFFGAWHLLLAGLRFRRGTGTGQAHDA